jgi:hypothetical protein
MFASTICPAFPTQKSDLKHGVVLHPTTTALPLLHLSPLLLQPNTPAAAARRLCQHLRWPLIDKDDTRDCLQALPAAALQLLNANRLSYDVMFR